LFHNERENMKIEPRNYVGIHYTLKLDDGEVLDSSEGNDPLGFIQGTGQIIEGLDKALLGKEVGEKFAVTVAPEEGYGEVNEEMHRELPRENFPEDAELEPGIGFTANGPHGPVAFTIVKAEGDTVTVDFNHPLAGKTLNFDVEIVETREPNAEELAMLASASACGDDDCEEGCAPTDCSSCGGGCS
jgi:FKBP-type peptidyl-prolyl cis-trans isomerase SlyD